MRNVRAVSIGDRISAESDEDMQDRTRVVPGDAAVSISSARFVELPSSGKPRIAARRLRRKVLRVGRRRE